MNTGIILRILGDSNEFSVYIIIFEETALKRNFILSSSINFNVEKFFLKFKYDLLKELYIR